MSGTYRHLSAGRYQLEVATGEGPAGIRRPDGRDVVLGIEGGTREFSLERGERVYYWWRGPVPRRGVHLRRSPDSVRVTGSDDPRYVAARTA